TRDLSVYAGELGVSQRQLARWRAEHLLPTPERRGRGRGAGASASYPEGTLEQLRAIVGLREAGVRVAADLRVHLWLLGHAMPAQVIRADLLDALPTATLPEDSDEALDALDAAVLEVEESWSTAREAPIDRRRLPSRSERLSEISQLLGVSLVDGY